MKDENATGNTSSSNSIEVVVEWVSKMGERGVYGGSSARLRRTSIDQLVSVLGADEPREVDWVLAHLDDLATRWGNRNQAKPSTVKTYRARAQGTLQDYIEFRKDPANFKPKQHSAKAEGAKNSGKSARKTTKGPASHDSVQPVCDGRTMQAPPDLLSRKYPLGNDREFQYVIPEQGMDTRDVYKIALHLLTMAADFNPADPDYGRMFALARRESNGH